MPKKRRVTGTTYHLVHRPHAHDRDGDGAAGADGGDGAMEWVHEADFRRGYRGKGTGGGGGTVYDEPLDVDAFAQHLGVDRSAIDGKTLGDRVHDEDDYEDVTDADEATDVAIDAHHTQADERSGSSSSSRHVVADEGGDDDDVLFDDAVECEVTDDFLRQLMFGQPGDKATTAAAAALASSGNGGRSHHGGSARTAAVVAPPPRIDAEAWQLMSEDERAAVLAAHNDTAAATRRTRVHFADDDDDAGVSYPTHDTDQRPLEAQFARMLHEFDVDACINDADTDDPRTHGALAMAQYMPALEEFVAERAGVDMATAEPAKNKGLLQQLRLLAHRAGVFDVSKDGGVFRTTVASEKEARFVAAFRAETERIREEARRRMQQQQQQQQQQTAHEGAAETATERRTRDRHTSGSNNSSGGGHHGDDDDGDGDVEEDEELVTIEVKTRGKGAAGAAERMDCESAVSAYSTYFNQPNVITATAPSTRAQRRARGRVRAAQQQETPHDTGSMVATAARDVDDAQTRVHAVHALSRQAAETAEERRLRKHAVKAAQRARRHEKTILRQTYKAAEAQEVRRAALANTDRATMHFV